MARDEQSSLLATAREESYRALRLIPARPMVDQCDFSDKARCSSKEGSGRLYTVDTRA